MKIYEARILLKSPAIITTKRTERGYVKPLNYIPGSMLRGSILSALYRDHVLELQDLEMEAKNPNLLSSPAFPVVNDKKTLPATPFMNRCKICNQVLDQTREISRALKFGENLLVYCPRDGGPMEPLYSNLIYIEADKIKKFKPRSFRATSVGISKERRSAVKGLLFDYEAIAEGTEFWAWISVLKDFRLPKKFEISFGRGQSRGFGWAEIDLNLVNLVNTESSTDVFVALSPFTPIETISWRDWRLKVNRILGRIYTAPLGWDMIKNEPRPLAKLVKPGSLIFAETSCNSTYLRTGLPLEVADSWVVGLNSIITIDEYYKILGGS